MIVLFSLFAFVLLIVGAGAATAIVLKDNDSPGKSKSLMEPTSDEFPETTFREFEQLMEENDIELYYTDYGDPQNEYISSHHTTKGYYTGEGEHQAIYQNAYDATEMSLLISWYLHIYEKIDDDL